jgi:hypothetical protein
VKTSVLRHCRQRTYFFNCASSAKGELFERALYLLAARLEELHGAEREALLRRIVVIDFSSREAISPYNILSRWPYTDPDFFVTNRLETLRELLPASPPPFCQSGVCRARPAQGREALPFSARCFCNKLDVRMRRGHLTGRHVALLLPLHLPRALAPHLPGVRHTALRDPVLPLRCHHQAPRAGMSVRLSERDLRVLAKCAVCRWLTTSQLQRVYFPHVTLDAVRKSLRRLHDAGYLVSHREHRMAEALYGVGPNAKPLLEAKDLAVTLSRTPPRQIAHLIGINDMRLAVEVEPERLAYFFAAWEFGGLGWTHTLIPDAVFALILATSGGFGLEVDCGTEPLKMLVNKVKSYESGLPNFPAVRGGPFHSGESCATAGIRPLPVCGASIGEIQMSGPFAPFLPSLVLRSLPVVSGNYVPSILLMTLVDERLFAAYCPVFSITCHHKTAGNLGPGLLL